MIEESPQRGYLGHIEKLLAIAENAPWGHLSDDCEAFGRAEMRRSHGDSALTLLLSTDAKRAGWRFPEENGQHADKTILARVARIGLRLKSSQYAGQSPGALAAVVPVSSEFLSLVFDYRPKYSELAWAKWAHFSGRSSAA